MIHVTIERHCVLQKLYYERPNCEVRNLNDGKPEFGVTTYLCNMQDNIEKRGYFQRTICLLFYLQRVAFKFIITTEQQYLSIAV